MCVGVEVSVVGNLEGVVIRSHLFKPDVGTSYPDFLRDESRRAGQADTLSFALDEDDIRRVLAAGLPVTLQGARTGITGGAVPNGGNLLNLSRMLRITGFRYDSTRNTFLVTVQPGLPLVNLRKSLKTCHFDTDGWSGDSLEALARYRLSPPCFFPPDPTETSATLGGMVACNASGACTFHYGATRPYVESLRVILADGSVLSLRRGREKAEGRAFTLTTEAGRRIKGRLPDYTLPQVKNAAGYYSADDMDLVDLFIGSEGTLGVISEIELRLVPLPACRWAVLAFFPSDAEAVSLVMTVRSLAPAERPVAIEYFDRHALNLLRDLKDAGGTVPGIPDLPANCRTALYLEYHGDELQVADAVGAIPARMEAVGASGEAAWIADSERELERFKLFRHAVPETVNRLIDERRKKEPEITKLGTDMAVPDTKLQAILTHYRTGLDEAGLEAVMFGHIGNNHIHVNILPRTLQDYERGKDLYLQWARQVLEMGGTVSAEHGIGKFKVALLREMLGDAGVRQMRDVKRVLDPDGLLNCGNLF